MKTNKRITVFGSSYTDYYGDKTDGFAYSCGRGRITPLCRVCIHEDKYRMEKKILYGVCKKKILK